MGTLALGIGVGTAVLGAAWGLLWAPLPYAEPERLVTLHGVSPDGEWTGMSLPDALDVRDEAESFDGLAAFRRRSFGLVAGDSTDPPLVVQVGMVTSGWLEVLGTSPARGRGVTPEDEQQEHRIILLTPRLAQRLWSSEVAEDPRGRVVRVNEEPFTVTGLLPSGFRYPMGGEVPEAFIPVSRSTYANRGARSLDVVARLRPGVHLTTAREELKALAAGLARAHPKSHRDFGLTLQPLNETLRGSRRESLHLLAGASWLLFALALANVFHLVAARSIRRSRATAIRSALGARLHHLAGHHLAEGLVLTLGGIGLGWILAEGLLLALPWALTAFETPLPPGELQGLHGALVFSAVVLGLPPLLGFLGVPLALSRRRRLTPLLQGSSPPRSIRRRLGTALLITEVALATTLLGGGGLLVRSLDHAAAVDPGFTVEDVRLFGLGLPAARYATELDLARFHERLVRELEALPGIRAAAFAARRPWTGSSYESAFQREDRPVPDSQRPRAAINLVSPGFFEVLQIPRLTGRGFTTRDDAESPRALIVNRSFEENFFPDTSPVGRRLTLSWWSELSPPETVWEIVGVVADVREAELDGPPRPSIYLPVGQLAADGGTYFSKLEKPGAGPSSEELQAAVDRVDPGLERIRVRSLDDLSIEYLAPRRQAAVLAGIATILAVALALWGIYGVVSLDAAERRREVAIRLTLGASRRSVVARVLGRVVHLAAWGLVLGFGLFVVLARVLESRLYGVTSTDPVSLLVAGLGLVATALIAAWAPAWEAAGTPPGETLR